LCVCATLIFFGGGEYGTTTEGVDTTATFASALAWSKYSPKPYAMQVTPAMSEYLRALGVRLIATIDNAQRLVWIVLMAKTITHELQAALAKSSGRNLR